MSYVSLRKTNFNLREIMDKMVMNNRGFRQGWISGYYPYSEYGIVNNQLVFSGDENSVDQGILIRDTIAKSQRGFHGGGGRIRELAEFRVKGRGVAEAFENLEKKVDKFLEENRRKEVKNGLEKMYLLTLRSLGDKDKKIIKIYKKKNI